jgi:hypothetical protein
MQVYRIVQRYLAKVADVVREGQQSGEIRRDLDPALTALHSLGIVQSAATLWFLRAGRPSARFRGGSLRGVPPVAIGSPLLTLPPRPQPG